MPEIEETQEKIVSKIQSELPSVELGENRDNDGSIEIEKLSEYISFVEDLDVEYSLSRGHGSIRYSLLPSAYREEKGIRKYESKSVKYFLDQFIVNATNHFKDDNLKPTNELEWEAYGQHFGVPTRLLDFSFSPLISLYFAVEKSFDSYKDDDAVVWFLNPKKLNEKTTDNRNILNISEDTLPSRINDPFVVQAKRLNNRIHSQQGAFVFFNGCTKPLEKTFEEDILKKLIIKADYKKKILVSLHDIGFGVSSLYPELEYVSKDIIMNYNIKEFKKES